MKTIINWSVILILFVISCNNHHDKFYTNKGGMDYTRIPLIKPYELTNSGNGWLLSFLHYKVNQENWSYVNAIALYDSIIIIKWMEDPNITLKPDTTWCFIVPAKKAEVKFRDENLFLDSLRHYTARKPVYRDIEKVWQQYKNTGYLDWFPTNYKK